MKVFYQENMAQIKDIYKYSTLSNWKNIAYSIKTGTGGLFINI